MVRFQTNDLRVVSSMPFISHIFFLRYSLTFFRVHSYEKIINLSFKGQLQDLYG